MDERNIEFGIREARGLPDGEILDYATARIIEDAENLSRILEEISLADLYAACYDAAAEPIRAVPRRVRLQGKPPPSIGRGQSWIRVGQRTVKASGRLHPRQQTQHRRICINYTSGPGWVGAAPFGKEWKT